MRPIRADLWEGRVDRPYPGLTTHAYLWTGGTTGNVLFYGTRTDADFDAIGIEVIPTPFHSPGSTSYLVPGVNGQTYLFTGDTIMLGAEGHWVAGHITPMSQAGPLADSLRLLGTLRPDLVISSAYPGDTAVRVPGATHWADCVAQARSRLDTVA